MSEEHHAVQGRNKFCLSTAGKSLMAFVGLAYEVLVVLNSCATCVAQ